MKIFRLLLLITFIGQNTNTIKCMHKTENPFIIKNKKELKKQAKNIANLLSEGQVVNLQDKVVLYLVPANEDSEEFDIEDGQKLFILKIRKTPRFTPRCEKITTIILKVLGFAITIAGGAVLLIRYLAPNNTPTPTPTPTSF